MNNKIFNIILTGVGGQGIITLVQIIGQAAFLQGLDVKSSELHGLSQRGGSVLAHIRFGKKIYSPVIEQGEADLIIGLEPTEALRAGVFADSRTVFLADKKIIPFLSGLPEREVVGKLEEIAGRRLHLVSASEICQKELGKEVVSGIYLLGCAVYNNLLPLKEKSVLQAIKNIIPEKYLELNIKAFGLTKK